MSRFRVGGLENGSYMSHYAELKNGDSFTRHLTVTDSLMQSFREISGDDNPLHVNEGFATAQRFAGRVAYGNLIGLMISSAVGVEMQALDPMLISETIVFHKPIYCGDTIVLTASVSTKMDATEVAELKYRAENQQRELVASGKILVKFL
jgi:3-hydroxybutyryl-CoA dehydratase